MIVICPSCRAPSNTSEPNCWVCHRTFDGSEPVIGELPGARRALRLADVQEREYLHEHDEPQWRRVS